MSLCWDSLPLCRTRLLELLPTQRQCADTRQDQESMAAARGLSMTIRYALNINAKRVSGIESISGDTSRLNINAAPIRATVKIVKPHVRYSTLNWSCDTVTGQIEKDVQQLVPDRFRGSIQSTSTYAPPTGGSHVESWIGWWFDQEMSSSIPVPVLRLQWPATQQGERGSKSAPCLCLRCLVRIFLWVRVITAGRILGDTMFWSFLYSRQLVCTLSWATRLGQVE